MAKQHFYSRVPAKMSMYHRSDGFDTFAHSANLNREFIEKELSAVYENKLNKNDLEAVRKGLMPLVYSQCPLRSGNLVQTCIRYLPLDFTGERSSYLAHTLILEEKEKELLFYSDKNAPLNPEMFFTDMDAFDPLSPLAAANDRYPDKDYVACPMDDTKELLEKYNPDTMRDFLFALLSVLCAKGKTIYFKLPYDDTEVSKEALRFICSVMAVIPYHLRENLSFVTYTTDPAQYAFAKLKCVSEHCPEIPAAKGVFIDLCTNLVTGLPTKDMAAAPVGFFYSLLENSAIRKEFLLFIDRAVQMIPALERMNLKTLSDLVFLFGGASGLFPQQTILPNDAKVYDFLCVYEKYRNALSEEYRKNAYGCLERYPMQHEAIPKNIFTKLSRLYPTETDSAKSIAMNTVLALIHTDIMRDKLFTFIRNNYDNEDSLRRATIISDLCRVYYGGFLQSQLLSFFSEHYAAESKETRDTIFRKLMLTIRTESIQPRILEFIEQNYGIFSIQQKQCFYTTFYEMLPECDNLSASLICFVNRQIETETAEIKEQVREQITRLLESDSRKQEPRLMPLLCKDRGFCCDCVLGLVFGEWNTRKIYQEYICLLSERAVADKTERLLDIWRATSLMSEAVAKKLQLSLASLYENDAKNATLYDWMEADRILQNSLTENRILEKSLTEKNFMERYQAFISFVQTTIIQPAIAHSLFDVFRIELGRNGIDLIMRYAKDTPSLGETSQYRFFTTFLQLQKAVEDGNAKDAFHYLENSPEEKQVRADIAAYIHSCLMNTDTQTPQQYLLYEMCRNRLRNWTLLSENLYADCKELCLGQLSLDPKFKGNVTKIAAEASCLSAAYILEYLTAACQTSALLREAVCADTDGLNIFLDNFSGDYGKSAKKWLLSHLTSVSPTLSETIVQQLSGSKQQGTGLFAKLFKKN